MPANASEKWDRFRDWIFHRYIIAGQSLRELHEDFERVEEGFKTS